jgi:hypothetical protein
MCSYNAQICNLRAKNRSAPYPSDFQAAGFYERHGYSVFGVLDDMPLGHKRFFLKRALAR